MGKRVREIKFRMFDTLEKNFMHGSRVIESRINDLNKGGRFVYQQWTGLKDKNGKEIYEGDIVTGVNRIFEGDVKQNVHFLNGCFMFGNWNAHEFFNKHQFIEVIGNIYANKELLESEHE